MTPELAVSDFTGHIYVVTRWDKARRAALTKYDVTEQFHAMAKRLGYVLAVGASKETDND